MSKQGEGKGERESTRSPLRVPVRLERFRKCRVRSNTENPARTHLVIAGTLPNVNMSQKKAAVTALGVFLRPGNHNQPNKKVEKRMRSNQSMHRNVAKHQQVELGISGH